MRKRTTLTVSRGLLPGESNQRFKPCRSRANAASCRCTLLMRRRNLREDRMIRSRVKSITLFWLSTICGEMRNASSLPRFTTAKRILTLSGSFN